MKLPELLSPAGNLEKAKLAIDFGADAVYIGGKAYSLRARASNFDIEQIKEIVEYAHQRSRKVYVATNVICHNALLNGFKDYAKLLAECKIDAIIAADPYIISEFQKITKDVEVHISTQQSVTNSWSARFWKTQGATRVVLAREVELKELQLLMKNLNNEVEIEYFVHGAVCIAYSGRCQMSNNFSHRDANVGGCAHSCRWMYSVKNNDIEEQNQKFTMSAKDMALMNFIPELIKTGIASFKIEGRMKSLHYVATIINSYRKAINESEANKKIDKVHINEIAKAANRPAGVAWFNGSPGFDQILYRDNGVEQARQEFAFQVVNTIGDGEYEVITKNNFQMKQKFEVFGPHEDSPLREIKILKIKNKNGIELEVSNRPMEHVIIKTDNSLFIKDIGRIKS